MAGASDSQLATTSTAGGGLSLPGAAAVAGTLWPLAEPVLRHFVVGSLQDGDVTSIYVSQARPRWVPQSEQDLADAIGQGLLEETHHLDLKREVPATRASNKELARDLAQFAVDGGTLLIGVEEVAGAAPVLSPTPLAGLSERVEQVAHSAVDPPLFVSSFAIPSAANPDNGYLVVQVPASVSAPHMVDGVYLQAWRQGADAPVGR